MMKTSITIYITLMTLLSSCRSSNSGEVKVQAQITLETFRFVGTRTKVFPAYPNDKNPITELYGVFSFRYSSDDSIAFWGFDQPHDNRFEPRFTMYQIKRTIDWKSLDVGYCGTGAETYVLQSDIDYILEIPLGINDLEGAKEIKVSIDSPDGSFWSEPFNPNTD